MLEQTATMLRRLTKKNFQELQENFLPIEVSVSSFLARYFKICQRGQKDDYIINIYQNFQLTAITKSRPVLFALSFL